ncbi:hypothetical protein, partial [Tsukamurella soli]|uniref:hypothetical protein n=1 Tax=Tsukamurella soli TaxID=644556 RepID=UPI0031E88DD5
MDRVSRALLAVLGVCLLVVAAGSWTGVPAAHACLPTDPTCTPGAPGGGGGSTPTINTPTIQTTAPQAPTT